MHAVGVRSDYAKSDPSLPAKVFQMYSQAKQKTYQGLNNMTSLKITLPWLTQDFEETRAVMGKNYWPYGIQSSKKELEHVMRYCYEQHLVKKRVPFQELFHPSTLELVEKI